MNMKKRSIFLFFLLCFLHLSTLSAQDLLKINDLSQVKADQLSDQDIAKFNKQLQDAGLTIDQAEQLALSKGMQAAEIAKLKQRMQMLGPAPQVDKAKNSTEVIRERGGSAVVQSAPEVTEKRKTSPEVFGAELFKSASLSFEPNLKIATPLNYQLGVDDQIQVSIFGLQENTMELTISTEGIASIPNVGQVKLLGLTIEEATQKLKQVLSSSVYPTLRSGTSKMAVSLSRIRSIRVTIMGAYKPGNYTLSSLSTLFNALYVCGGPGDFGSYREIELIRDNKVIRIADLYKFLVGGDQTDNVLLRDNDVIRIPVYKNHVTISGQVKREGIFEILPGENFDKLLLYASGFTDTAYRASVKIVQLTDKERRVKDIVADDYKSYLPQSGDIIFVSKLLDRFKNRVGISGAVFREGFFELTEGMSISDLIQKADGLKEDAFTVRGQLVRLKKDLTKEILSFDVARVLQKDAAENLKLQREDEIIITSIFDLKSDYKVIIQGEIRVPGEYLYLDSLSLKDLLLLAGGLTDAAQPQRIEIGRLLKRDTLTAQDERASEIIEVKNGDDLSIISQNIALRPFDVITIRKKPGYIPLQSVSISGEVQYPGGYVIAARSEKISDLIRRAGGFTPEAYLAGAYLKRQVSALDKQLRHERVNKIQESLKDTSRSVLEDVERMYDQIPLNMEYIMQHRGAIEDLVLKAKDELVIPKFDAQIRISGNVLVPTQIPFNGDYRFRDYLIAAGGFADNAKRSKIYVLYPNGKAATVRHFLVFKRYPRIIPGTEIIVPKKQEKKRLSTGESIGLASAVASLAGVVIAILNLTK